MPALPLALRPPVPWVPLTVLVAGDLVAFSVAALVLQGLRELVFGPMPYPLSLWGAAVGWIGFRFYSELYPGYGLPGPEELRRATLTTVVAGLGHASIIFATKEEAGSRFIAIGTWTLLLGTSWLLRSYLKGLLIRLDLYTCPVIVAGAGMTGALAVRELVSNRSLGLVPVAAFDDDPAKQGRSLEGVPILGPLREALRVSFPYPVRHAILAIRGANPRFLTETARAYATRYPKLAIVPDLFGLASLWVRQRPLGAVLTLEIHNNLLHTPSRLAKRALDLALALPLFLISLPVVLLAGLLVKAVSPGPMFFVQRREGINGKPIRVWKIRTMVPNAEDRLAEYLALDGAALAQWEQRMKLRRDPRLVPGIGGILRRFSLDELPQFWNVLKGEMSLVGPRPFPPYHLQRFSEQFQQMRRQVPAGLTGLWQVSERGDGDLQVQETADSFYIQNWSLWLDLWILLKTFRVVLQGKGAY